MDPRVEAAPATGTLLGTFEITLQADPGGTTYATTTITQTTSDSVAREVALVVGGLLFAQRQMRSINDPARFAAVDDIATSCAAVREGRLPVRALGPGARPVATYRIELLANGSFRINVDQRLSGMLHDSAGSLPTAALMAELLSTLNDPYRTFLREMLEASQLYWRDRRPSAVESTWDWGVALGRLNQLVQQGPPSVIAIEHCDSCKAYRPAGYPCLRCGTPPNPSQTLRAAPMVPAAPIQPIPVVPELRAAEVLPVSQPIVVAPTPVLPPTPALSPPPAVFVPPSLAPSAALPSRPEPERTILPAREAPAAPVVTLTVEESIPLASLGRRLGAWAIDIVSGGLLAVIGAFGISSILLATNSVTSADNPQEILAVIWVTLVGLYLILGWFNGETLGMLLLGLRIVRSDTRLPVGIGRSFLRGIGSLLLLAFGVAAIGVVVTIDIALPFVQGAGDIAMRLAALAVGLYIIWSGSGQRIIGSASRQTLGDRIAGTVVVERPRN